MLISFLDKPNVDIKVKTKVIKKLFDKSISTEAFNLIHLLSKTNLLLIKNCIVSSYNLLLISYVNK